MSKKTKRKMFFCLCALLQVLVLTILMSVLAPAEKLSQDSLGVDLTDSYSRNFGRKRMGLLHLTLATGLAYRHERNMTSRCASATMATDTIGIDTDKVWNWTSELSYANGSTPNVPNDTSPSLASVDQPSHIGDARKLGQGNGRVEETMYRGRATHRVDLRSKIPADVLKSGADRLPSLSFSQFNAPKTNEGFSLFAVTSPRFSKFTIVDRKRAYRLCDRLHIHIEARDRRNRMKTFGGDYFRARIYNSELKAGAASEGDIVDHANGSYTTSFILRWPGEVFIQVQLVHPSEAVAILRRVRDSHPSRCGYTGRFEKTTKTGTIWRSSDCNVIPPTHVENATICNFTNRLTGNPWFCIKPRDHAIQCGDYTWNAHNWTQTVETARSLVSEAEAALFDLQKYPIKSDAPRGITVLPPVDIEQSWLNACHREDLPTCRPGVHVGKEVISSGFFFNDIWYSNHCKLLFFKPSGMLECLTNKTLYIHGDSTARQYYEFLVKKLGKHMKPDPSNRQPNWKVGPLVARDKLHNFTLRYRHHGFPIRNNEWTKVGEVRSIASALDNLPAGPDTVFLFSMWAHFTASNLALYQHALKGIRAAVERLHMRSPETLVVLKSAHAREHKGSVATLISSDWFAKQLDIKMREVFADYDNIAFIDQWSITVAHRDKDIIHPLEEVVWHGVRTLLSFICPSE